MQDFERLGLFYLGKRFDVETKRPTDELVLYESKDLVTHAVCVGMTGSGKTGLCVCLLEEALIDGIPALAIDPKGDIANLLLTFPELKPHDFEPWVNADDAARKGLSRDEYASQQAETWRKGLAAWGQTPERIGRLRASGDIAVFTPGSTAGLPLSIVQSFAAPGPEVMNDPELLRDQTQSAAASLLGLLGVASDAIHGREQILLGLILESAWREGRDLTLADIVRLIQEPGLARVGAVDLETFYPAKERFELSLRLNNLMAAPGFDVWLSGAPVDMKSLLYTDEGKPRIAIISIAHLNDQQRMFVVSLLFKQVLAWMRGLPGTTSLRAIVYMDEVAGYFPPSAMPPSKSSMLTLMKQGRAFGIGCVLATQNPVDLDYKGLSNAGTWFLGRLQTERDKARVLDGLEGVAASGSLDFDRARVDKLLSSLTNRVFLMNNVHDDAPEVFQARWAMSYLRGPLARDEIQRLMADRKADTSPRAAASEGSITSAVARPILPPDVKEFFVPLRSERPAGANLAYKPALLGLATVHYQQAKLKVDATMPLCALRPLAGDGFSPEWDWFDEGLDEPDLDRQPIEQASYAALPGDASRAKSYARWEKELADTIYQSKRLELLSCPLLELDARPDEDERAFRIRLRDSAREARDVEVEKLRQKFAAKIAAAAEQVRKAEQVVAREEEQASQQKWQSWISAGANALGALLGRRRISASNIGRAERSIRGFGRNRKEEQDVLRAQDNLQVRQERQQELEAEAQAEIAKLTETYDPDRLAIERREVKPRRTDIAVRLVSLVWLPHWIAPTGEAVPAWR